MSALRPHLTRRGVLALPLLSVAACSSATSSSTSAPPSAPTPSPSITPTPSPTPTPTPTPTPSAKRVDWLTGGAVSKNAVYAVKIDNTWPARPQIGLDSADLVVAELVEGGLTRLIGIFHTHFPTVVGPVRSARNTDVQLLPVFGRPGLVYSGANRLVQAQVDKASVVPIERSDRDPHRAPPHNVMVNLRSIAATHTVGGVRDIGLRFGPATGIWATAAKVAKITTKIGGDTYGFSHGSSGYVVTWNGQTYSGSGHALTCDNVMIMHVHEHKDTHSTSDLSIVSDTVGQGEVDVYRNGRMIKGTWKRTAGSAPFTFTVSGKPITLDPGRTWVLLHA